jgi:hypothetical protein
MNWGWGRRTRYTSVTCFGQTSTGRDVGMRTIRITAVTPDEGISASPAAGVPIADTAASEVHEADEVIHSHADLLAALNRLGQ